MLLSRGLLLRSPYRLARVHQGIPHRIDLVLADKRKNVLSYLREVSLRDLIYTPPSTGLVRLVPSGLRWGVRTTGLFRASMNPGSRGGCGRQLIHALRVVSCLG